MTTYQIINSIIAGAGGGSDLQSYTLTSDISTANAIVSLLDTLIGTGRGIIAWYDGDASATGYNHQFVIASRGKIGKDYTAGVRYSSGSYNTLSTDRWTSTYGCVLKTGQKIKYYVVP